MEFIAPMKDCRLRGHVCFRRSGSQWHPGPEAGSRYFFTIFFLISHCLSFELQPFLKVKHLRKLSILLDCPTQQSSAETALLITQAFMFKTLAQSYPALSNLKRMAFGYKILPTCRTGLVCFTMDLKHLHGHLPPTSQLPSLQNCSTHQTETIK